MVLDGERRRLLDGNLLLTDELKRMNKVLILNPNPISDPNPNPDSNPDPDP